MTVNIKNWQELKKPNSLEIKPGNDPKRRATFVAEPLERGFGLTLGNALRRVLLSSLPSPTPRRLRLRLPRPLRWLRLQRRQRASLCLLFPPGVRAPGAAPGLLHPPLPSGWPFLRVPLTALSRRRPPRRGGTPRMSDEYDFLLKLLLVKLPQLKLNS